MGVVIEYIRSLSAVGVTVQHFLYELVINALVRAREFYQLHQLLQYHVLADSKPLVSCLWQIDLFNKSIKHEQADTELTQREVCN